MSCNCESQEYHNIDCIAKIKIIDTGEGVVQEFGSCDCDSHKDQTGKVTRRTDDAVHDLPGLPQLDQDFLLNIFHYQRKFMDMLGVPCLDSDGRGKELDVNEFTRMLTNFTQTCTTALACETTELLDALPWKPWKKSYEKIDLNNVHIEIVDMMHFLVELAIIWGMKPQQLHGLYMKKMQENFDRQSKGY